MMDRLWSADVYEKNMKFQIAEKEQCRYWVTTALAAEVATVGAGLAAAFVLPEALVVAALGAGVFYFVSLELEMDVSFPTVIGELLKGYYGEYFKAFDIMSRVADILDHQNIQKIINDGPGKDEGDMPFNPSYYKNEFEDMKNTVSPIALDLDGDGMEFVKDGAYFDYDASGFAEKATWLAKDDG